jgi:hypothetical protein
MEYVYYFLTYVLKTMILLCALYSLIITLFSFLICTNDVVPTNILYFKMKIYNRIILLGQMVY